MSIEEPGGLGRKLQCIGFVPVPCLSLRFSFFVLKNQPIAGGRTVIIKYCRVRDGWCGLGLEVAAGQREWHDVPGVPRWPR